MILVIFNSTHDALAAEQALITGDYKIRIIPTPRQFTHSCGLSIRVNSDNYQDVKKLLQSKGVSDFSIYQCINENGRINYGIELV